MRETLRDKLYRFFVNYNHLIEPIYCGCKKCNYAGVYEGLSFEEICNGKKNIPNVNLSIKER